ncbi:putative RNA methyltransferase-domain-containing protein [Sporodiniella umbellata]|nr:putative RNA methyltransferase-domain-containing protein [Sporodiniella umbellata]
MIDKKKRAYENKDLSGPDYGKERAVKRQDVKKSLIPDKARKYTVTMAIPSSVIDSAPTLELKTLLAGQIARALALFCVDEVVIYEDKVPQSKVNASLFLARLFQYMETPPYLRKALVPISPDLKFAGLLAPLDVPHHPTKDEMTLYREGVTLDKADDQSTLVDVGLFRRARIDRPIQPNVRVTVELQQVVAAADTKKGQKPIQARVVSPKVPREMNGIYWGYQIRLASSFSKVMTEAVYEYDFSIGVSDRKGDSIYQSLITDKVKPFSHLLIAFGAPNGGLEEAIEADEDLKVGGEDAEELFDLFIQPTTSGSRSIRLEKMRKSLSLLTQKGLNSFPKVLPLTPLQLNLCRKHFSKPVSFIKSISALDQAPELDRPEVAFVGRSNVGKSTLINTLVNHSRLVRTSSKPGHTRLLNFFNIGDQITLVDMPGYGYRSKTEWGELILNYLSQRRQLKRLFLLVDPTAGLKETDKALMQHLDEQAVSYQIVLTKRDKLSENEFEASKESICRYVLEHGISCFPQLLISGKKRKNNQTMIEQELMRVRYAVLYATNKSN